MRRPSHHRAFTLVELLVSIAIALLLIIGVNTVFKITSQTVGAGNALLSANRDARTVFQTFLADANNVDPVPGPGSTSGDGPFFVIRSEHVYAFRNAADQQGATSPTDPSTDTNLFPAFPSNQAPVPFIHYRSHRIDRLGFFSRGVFARQTSDNSSQFVSPTGGAEALVYYGHSQQPNNPAVSNGGTWYDPGASNQNLNKNNYYAADWMLSRMAMILKPSPTQGSRYLNDNGGLSPLNLGPAASPWASSQVVLTSDLAATSIANYGLATRPGGIQAYSFHLGATNSPGNLYGKDWWDPVINYRYEASPFVLAGTATPKITPATLSQCAPDLIRGCSQVIVEYAGNFYTKKADGTAVDTTSTDSSGTVHHVPVPDPTGQIDFYTTLNSDQSISRKTRWYGYPRAVSSANVNPNNGDVVPLRDVLAMLNTNWATNNGMSQSPAPANSGLYADAERFSANFPQPSGSTPPAYWTAMSASTDQTARYTYTAAWGPDVQYQAFPKMIRIILEIDDHEGRMSQPQRYEFIYDVQQ